jgi:hypothetical protein
MAAKVTELQFSTRNKVGALADIATKLEKAKVNILHIWACGEGGTACFGIVTNNNAKAKKILKGLGIKIKEKGLLVSSMSNKVGSLARAARKLAKAKINITCLAATTSGKRASVLIGTNQDSKAARLV